MGSRVYLNSIYSMVTRTSVHSRRSTAFIRRPAVSIPCAQWGAQKRYDRCDCLLRGLIREMGNGHGI